jgi:hypothetical protein
MAEERWKLKRVRTACGSGRLIATIKNGLDVTNISPIVSERVRNDIGQYRQRSNRVFTLKAALPKKSAQPTIENSPPIYRWD